MHKKLLLYIWAESSGIKQVFFNVSGNAEV